MTSLKEFKITVSDEKHLIYAHEIEMVYEQLSKERTIGLNLKKGEYLGKKIKNGDAVIATKQGQLAGFCYLRKRNADNYVSISGVVVLPEFRKLGLGSAMVNEAFQLVRNRYPKAKLFSLTTSPEIMRVNTFFGYKPVNYSKLSTSDEFWNECKDCPNFHILKKNSDLRCLCSAMLFNPFSFNIEDEYQLNDQSLEKSNAS